MRTLIALAAAMMLAASASAISRPTGLVAQSWTAPYYNRWYTLETGVYDLMVEGSSRTVVARQMTTGTVRATWTNMDGDDWRMVDGTGTSSINRLKIYSYDTSASRTVLTVKTLGSSMTSPTFTDSNHTLPTWRSDWSGMTSVDGVIYMYSGRYLIGLSASTGALVTNMTLGSTASGYIAPNAVAVGYAYADGAKFLTFKFYTGSSYRQMTVDIRRNYVTMNCSPDGIYSSSSSYTDAYPAFAPSYSSGSSTIYPMIFAWGSTSSYSYGAMVNVTSASCSYIWRRSTSSVNIPPIRLEGSRTSTIRPGMPFTFQDTTNAIYASFDSISDDGDLIWLNYRTGATTRTRSVDNSISSFTDDQCSTSLMVGPTTVGTDLILSFDMYLYQYTSTGTQSWSFNYGSVFSSSLNIDDAGCAAWSYKVVGTKTLFVSNGGGVNMAAMAIGTSSSNGGTSYTPTPGSSSSSSYSPYYQVTMTNGQTGSTAKATIQSTLFAKYGITSSSLSSWYYSGNYITFRVYYGLTRSTAETNTASGLLAATTNSTLRRELGFASCSQTIDPNFGAAVAAAFGTLFIVLILIGVAILICVIAIIVCCCCCTAKAVADASAPPQQTVVMANQAAYVPMNQQVQPGYAQPGQIQGGNML